MLKNIIRKTLLTFLLAATFITPILSAGDYHVEFQPQVIEQVVQLEQKGVLKQKDNGYLYLEVSDDFIAQTLPVIQMEGKLVPPRHYTSKKGIGAHISVMYENELIDNEIWSIKELGQEYTFTVLEVRTVKIYSDKKLKKLWLIAVDAPELSQLRQSYGLSPLLKGHDFHITIGTQVPGAPQAEPAYIILEEEIAEAA